MFVSPTEKWIKSSIHSFQKESSRQTPPLFGVSGSVKDFRPGDGDRDTSTGGNGVGVVSSDSHFRDPVLHGLF